MYWPAEKAAASWLREAGEQGSEGEGEREREREREKEIHERE